MRCRLLATSERPIPGDTFAYGLDRPPSSARVWNPVSAAGIVRFGCTLAQSRRNAARLAGGLVPYVRRSIRA